MDNNQHTNNLHVGSPVRVSGFALTHRIVGITDDGWFVCQEEGSGRRPIVAADSEVSASLTEEEFNERCDAIMSDIRRLAHEGACALPDLLDSIRMTMITPE